jgi:hypothetical protein
VMTAKANQGGAVRQPAEAPVFLLYAGRLNSSQHMGKGQAAW